MPLRRSQWGLVIAITAFLVAGCGRDHPSDAEAEEFKVKAEPIINALEDYYASHGEYPCDLADAGVEPLKTRFGSSQYEKHLNGKMRFLIIGQLKPDPDWDLHWSGMGGRSEKKRQQWTFIVYRK